MSTNRLSFSLVNVSGTKGRTTGNYPPLTIATPGHSAVSARRTSSLRRIRQREGSMRLRTLPPDPKTKDSSSTVIKLSRMTRLVLFLVFWGLPLSISIWACGFSHSQCTEGLNVDTTSSERRTVHMKTYTTLYGTPGTNTSSAGSIRYTKGTSHSWAHWPSQCNWGRTDRSTSSSKTVDGRANSSSGDGKTMSTRVFLSCTFSTHSSDLKLGLGES